MRPKIRSFWHWLLYSDASSYLRYRRACHGCDRTGEREENWYGDAFED
jgi:hypothetical protein